MVFDLMGLSPVRGADIDEIGMSECSLGKRMTDSVN